MHKRAEMLRKMCLHIFRSISVRLYMADAISERPKQSGGLELACVEPQRISVRLYMADAISERPKQSGGLELACVEPRRRGRINMYRKSRPMIRTALLVITRVLLLLLR